MQIYSILVKKTLPITSYFLYPLYQDVNQQAAGWLYTQPRFTWHYSETPRAMLTPSPDNVSVNRAIPSPGRIDDNLRPVH